MMERTKQSQKPLSVFAAVALSLLATTAQSADPVDRKVKAWIAVSLGASSGLSELASDAILTKRYAEKALDAAWGKLKDCRDANNSLNMDLAAAEHYMFARFQAAASGDTRFHEFPKWYETIKKKATDKGLQDYLRTTDQPVSPTNTKVTAWGERGVSDGLLDYTASSGKVPSDGASAWLVVLSSAAVHYYLHGTSAGNVTCTLSP